MGYATDNFQETYFDDQGAIRWSKNNRCLPEDCVQDLVMSGLVDDETVLCTEVSRDKETREFFAEYKVAKANRSKEQIAEEHMEARNAFGPDVTIIDIITGETI